MAKSEEFSVRQRSVWVGVLILLAYGVLISSMTDSGSVIMLADVISGIAVILIAMLMYPLFKGENGVLLGAYLVLKWVEGLLMIAAGAFAVFPALFDLRDPIYTGVHLYVFIISGALFYILLERRRLVPRFVNYWGLAGIAALGIRTIAGIFGMDMVILGYFVVLIITNEIFLAIWLFVKGFRVDA